MRRIFVFLAVTGALVCSLCSVTRAMPARPDPFTVKQPNGEIITIRLKGDEWFHWSEDTEGYPLVRSTDGWWSYAEASMDSQLVSTGLHVRATATSDVQAFKARTTQPQILRAVRRVPRPPLSETRAMDSPPRLPNHQYYLLMILIDFPDLTFTETPASFNRMMNSYDSTSGPSFRLFYLDNSYGQFETDATVVGWYRAQHNHGYYGCGSPPECNSAPAAELVREAVAAADAGVDLSQFDNNGDGMVDGLFVVHAGRGCEETNSPDDIWSHAGALDPPYVADGVSVARYTTEPEKLGSGHAQIGVFVHEFGHALGLPDLYDTNIPPAYPSAGLGNWSVMAGGNWNGGQRHPAFFDAWCKQRLQYINPVVPVTNPGQIVLGRSEANPVAYKLWANGVIGDEYFLAEYRNAEGTNENLDGRGLLIYHVDEAQSNNNNEWYPGHTDQGHYHVALEQADNHFDLEQNHNRGDGGDPYPGSSSNREFSASSSPNSNAYSDGSSQVTVTAIGNPGAESISVTISVSSSVPPYNLPITAAEYFIDTDPGPGNGTPANMSPSGTEVTVDQPVNPSSMPLGWHTLYLRFQRSDGYWSPALVGRRFCVTSAQAPISASEYFWDGDPGNGHGQAVSVTNGYEVTPDFPVSPASLSRGAHSFSLRFLKGGLWSGMVTRPVYVGKPYYPIAAAEFYVDDDPGAGHGTALTVQSGGEVVFTDPISPFSAAPGPHRFYVRFRTQDGLWSAPLGRNLCLTPAGENVIAGGELFFDADPGEGHGSAMLAEDGSFNQPEEAMYRTVEAATLDSGQHVAYVRVRDLRGFWSAVRSGAFVVASPPSLVAYPDNGAQQIRLTWTSFPGAISYTVHFDSVETGLFADSVTVAAPDTGTAITQIPGQGKRFFYVDVSLPTASPPARRTGSPVTKLAIIKNQTKR